MSESLKCSECGTALERLATGPIPKGSEHWFCPCPEFHKKSLSEPKEVITDETVIFEDCGPGCSVSLHLCGSIVMRSINNKYRTLLLEAEVKELKTDQAHSVKVQNEMAELIEKQAKELKEAMELLKIRYICTEWQPNEEFSVKEWKSRYEALTKSL